MQIQNQIIIVAEKRPSQQMCYFCSRWFVETTTDAIVPNRSAKEISPHSSATVVLDNRFTQLLKKMVSCDSSVVVDDRCMAQLKHYERESAKNEVLIVYDKSPHGQQVAFLKVVIKMMSDDCLPTSSRALECFKLFACAHAKKISDAIQLQAVFDGLHDGLKTLLPKLSISDGVKGNGARMKFENLLEIIHYLSTEFNESLSSIDIQSFKSFLNSDATKLPYGDSWGKTVVLPTLLAIVLCLQGGEIVRELLNRGTQKIMLESF